MIETTNEELVALVLPWAKDAHREYYDKTLKVATNATAFRKYLLRLVEIRSAEDKEWRNKQCPIRVLDETSIEITIRQKSTGATRVFKGRNAKPPIDHRINELALDSDSFGRLQAYKQELDLTYITPCES